ncbi:hypothetical protein ACLOJK_017924 [Asimina triloba]
MWLDPEERSFGKRRRRKKSGEGYGGDNWRREEEETGWANRLWQQAADNACKGGWVPAIVANEGRRKIGGGADGSLAGVPAIVADEGRRRSEEGWMARWLGTSDRRRRRKMKDRRRGGWLASRGTSDRRRRRKTKDRGGADGSLAGGYQRSSPTKEDGRSEEGWMARWPGYQRSSPMKEDGRSKEEQMARWLGLGRNAARAEMRALQQSLSVTASKIGTREACGATLEFELSNPKSKPCPPPRSWSSNHETKREKSKTSANCKSRTAVIEKCTPALPHSHFPRPRPSISGRRTLALRSPCRKNPERRERGVFQGRMGSEEARVSSPSPSPQLDSQDGVSNGGGFDSPRPDEDRASLTQLESGGAERDSGARVSEIKEEETSDSDRGSGEFYAAKPRVEESRASSEDSDSKGFDVEAGARVAEVKTEDVRFASGHVVEYSGTGPGGIDGGFEGKFAENDDAAVDGSSFRFEAGDMVWGKVKSHPWWPGHVYNEAFATSSVRRMKREGHVLVAFFGDSSYGWFNPAELVPFESHYAEKSCQTNSRNFTKAVEEAVDEAKRRRALGLACRCRNKFNFRPAGVKGYFAVDVEEYDPGMVYSREQINKAREYFQPVETLSFVQQLALAPRDVDEHSSLLRIQDVATVLAYRKAVFEEFDETYAQAFGIQPVRPSRLDEIQKSEKALPRGIY